MTSSSFPTIHKPDVKEMKLVPNLDYDRVRGNFDWSEMYGELDWLPGGGWPNGNLTYTERGEATYRQIPSDARAEDFRIWHPGYDYGPAMQDINCIFPLDRFRELESEGVIGSLADTHYSFMGFIPEPTERLIPETAPEAARLLKEDGIDAVFLAST